LVTAGAAPWIEDCMISCEKGGLMRKLVLAVGAVSALALGAFGCSHSLHEAKADYHQERAESAAEHGNYDKAAHEEHKAAREENKADNAPLP
jgi:hypothetical protein